MRAQLEQELEELTASLFEVRWAAWEWVAQVFIWCLVTTHVEVPPLPGSSQDGSGSQHEAGCIRKAVEGGLGQGETHPCVPRPALDGVYWPQPARARNRFLTDLLGIRNKRTRSGTGRVGLNLSSPGPPDSIGAPIPPWRFVLVCCSPGGPNG